MDTFKSSRPAVVELAARYKDIVSELEQKKTNSSSSVETPEQLEAAEKLLFTEMCEICLWGNATDLSLLTNLSYEDIQKLQGSEARKKSEKNILVNDLDKAFGVLRAAQKQGKKDRRVDIVLDNAGFELFVDLILAGYLVASGLATNVVFHPKSIPWFVSDVLPADFGALLSALADPAAFYEALSDDQKHNGQQAVPLSDTESANLRFLFQHWSGMHAEGQLMLRPNDFWTAAGSYWRLPKTEPELYEDLKESELVIFKGDLNYRKLTADVSMALLTIFFIFFTWLTSLTHAQTGSLARHHALHLRHRTHGTRLWHPRSRASHMQSRRSRRTRLGRRRAHQSHPRRRRRRRRQRSTKMGLERQMGSSPIFQWQSLNYPNACLWHFCLNVQMRG